MSITLHVENFRALRKIEWTLPKGVCALVGPNGSGKTTLLGVPELLSAVLTNGGVQSGLLGDYTSVESLRNFYADPTLRVMLGIDMDAIEWRIRIWPDEQKKLQHYEEAITEDHTTIVERSSLQPSYSYKGRPSTLEEPFQQFARDHYHQARGWDSDYRQPIAALAGYRLYRPFHLDPIRTGVSANAADRILNRQGTNVFTVLRNWMGKQQTKARYKFVIDNLREAFPDVAEDLDFDSSERGSTGHLVVPGSKKTLPITFAPNGWLTGLLHLTSVASTTRGGIVAIDEPENGLHPFAIKQLVAAMRDWADAEDLTILLATHSTVLIDQFKEEPSHLFVMEPGRDVLPVRLDEVRDPDWLSQFSLGDLYKFGEFGAPAEEQAPTGV